MMTKTEIINQIQILEEQLRSDRTKRREMEEILAALQEFKKRSDLRICAFEDSVTRRKQKLSGIDTLTATVKSARGYREAMNVMLDGTEYQSVTSQIEKLERSVVLEIQKTRSHISELDRNIQRLEERIRQLNYELNHLPEEIENESQ